MNRRELIVLLSVSVFICFITSFKVVFSPGVPILAEQIEVYKSTDFFRNFAYTWNDKLSTFNLADLPKYYLYYIIYLTSTFIPFSITIKLFLVLIHPISFVSMYIFLKKEIFYNMNNNRKGQYTFITLVIILLSLIYVFNPWITERSRNIILRYQYALLPILVLLYMELLESRVFKDSFRYAFLFSILFSFIETYRFLVKIVLFLFLILFFYVINKLLYSKDVSLNNILIICRNNILVIVLSSLFILPFYVPSILYLHYQVPQVANVFNINSITHESFINVFSLYFPSYPGSVLTNPYGPDDKRPLLFVFVVIFSGFSLLISKKVDSRHKWIYYSMLFSFVFFITLSLMPKTLTDLLVNHIYLGRILRQSYHNAFSLPFITVTILSFIIKKFIGNIYFKNRNIVYKKFVLSIFIIFTLIISIISSWPLVTGNLNGYWNPSEIPNDYKNLYKILEKENNTRIIVAPNYLTHKAVWMKSSSPYPSEPPAGLFDVLSQPLPSFVSNAVFFRYYYPLSGYLPNKNYIGYKGNNLAKIYSGLGIKYILIHYDIDTSRSWSGLNGLAREWVINISRQDKNVFKVYSGKYLTLLNLRNQAEQISMGEPIIINHGVYAIASVIDSINKPLKNYAFVYPIPHENVLLFINNSRMIVIRNPYELIPLIVDSPDLLKIPKYVNRNNVNPSEGWVHSSVSFSDFYLYLKKMGIDYWSWDIDYSDDLALTWAKFKEPKNLSLEDEVPYKEWLFKNESNCSNWIKNNLYKQFGSIQLIKCDNNNLEVKLYNSTRGWKVIKSPVIDIDPSHEYRIILRIRGVNSHKVHIKIAELDSEGKIIGIRYVKAVGDGTFNWKNIRFDYTAKNQSVKKIQIQIWHGHLTNKPLPNIIMIKDVKIYDITKFMKPVELNIKFSVRKTNRYRVMIRCFKNIAGGSIKLSLDGRMNSSIYTYDKLNKFTWCNVGTFKLSKGQHVLKIRNEYGFNVINLVIIIPNKNYQKLLNNLRVILKNKTVLYVYEGEFDMYHTMSKVLNNYTTATNGRCLLINYGGAAWRDIKILNSGFYVVSVRLKGLAVVQIDNMKYMVSNQKLDYSYIGPVFLSNGTHTLKISPVGKKLVSWFSGNQTDFDLWRKYNKRIQFNAVQELTYDYSEHALRMSLFNSTRGWKSINSPIVSISPTKTYLISFKLKAYNGHKIHLKIAEFNKDGKLIHLKYAKNIGDGSFNWKQINYIYKPFNSSVAYIQIQIWHGHLTNKPLPNIIMIKDVKIYETTSIIFDEVWVYTTNKQNKTSNIYDLFEVYQNPAKIKFVKRINPTLWKVGISVREPFILVFSESYNPLWRAEIYRNNRLVYATTSIPVYGVINGFWINQTGSLSIVIEYIPQKIFVKCLKISLTVFILSLLYLFYGLLDSARIRNLFRK